MTRHRCPPAGGWRPIDMEGDLKRFALTLVDRMFPEYAALGWDPLPPGRGVSATGQALIRETGLVPTALTERREEVFEIAARASRGMLDTGRVEAIIERPGESIGIAMGEEVMADQLRQTVGMIEFIEWERKDLDEELGRRVASLGSVLPSLGLNAPIIATIHATPGNFHEGA